MAQYADPENTLVIETTKGNVVIEMRPDLAPNHVAHIKKLVREGAYDGVVFHRVIDGFMAQTGDVKFGNSSKTEFNPARTGTGGSSYPDLNQEFNAEPHVRGTTSMARSQSPNSANSQFFICFDDARFLDRQYTVWGKVIEGMDNVDQIKRGEPVVNPDKMVSVKVAADIAA
jgi:cyclophilin family peptidyl-prolyl cis-trans isomerase